MKIRGLLWKQGVCSEIKGFAVKMCGLLWNEQLFISLYNFKSKLIIFWGKNIHTFLIDIRSALKKEFKKISKFFFASSLTGLRWKSGVCSEKKGLLWKQEVCSQIKGFAVKIWGLRLQSRVGGEKMGFALTVCGLRWSTVAGSQTKISSWNLVFRLSPFYFPSLAPEVCSRVTGVLFDWFAPKLVVCYENFFLKIQICFWVNGYWQLHRWDF